MSEHRRKPPQPQGGGRAAARRAQQSSGRRAAPYQGVSADSPSDPYAQERPYGGRAEARRAARRGGRRHPEGGAGAGHGGPGGRGGGGRGGGGGGGHDDGHSGRRRLIDYPRRGKHGWRRWMPSWKLTSTLCIGFLGSLMAAAALAYAWVQVPDPDRLAEAENNVYYWDDGSQMIATGGEVNRQNISISQIPKDMQNAVISAENKTFWKDSGVDPRGITRALFNMARGQETQSGSTITQQYVKNARLNDQSQTLSRKFKELFISIKIDNTVDKDEILTGYLNSSYYGRNAYGIQAAARTYYGKDAQRLNASECAVLASLLKGATWYDPAGTPGHPLATKEANTKRAEKRWRWILDEMVKDKYLDAAERDKFVEAGFPTPDPLKKGAKLGGQIGYLVDLAKENFLNNNDRGIDEPQLAQGGYEIHTTFNKEKIQKLEKTIAKVRKENIDPKKRPETDTHVQFGGASVEVGTGKIVAIYGGEDATKHYTNNADTTGAQVGSTFKPFVLAAAMRDGVRDPALGPVQTADQRTLVNPDKTVYNGANKLRIKRYDGEVWRNEEGKELLQVNDNDNDYDDLTLREAMVVSANSPFVQLGMDIGISKVREAAEDAGLRKGSLDKADVPSFSLGISTPSAIRMASAYSTFAASGEQRDPYSVQTVKKRGVTIYEHKSKPVAAFSPEIADNVTDVLRDVVDEDNGTGKNARIPGRQVAGKTGTTDGNKQAWFVGYTPQLSTAIDMYRMDDNEKSTDRGFQEMFGTGGKAKIHGSSFPSEIWQRYMAEALEGEPVKKFPKPRPIGETVYGGGAVSPEPTPSPTASESTPDPTPSATESESTPDPTPSATESSEPPASPSPTASESCAPWDQWQCGNPTSPSPTASASDSTNGGPGNPGGPGEESGTDGFWGGPGG